MHTIPPADTEGFLSLITDALGSRTVDFYPRMRSLSATARMEREHRAAGVLLLLRSQTNAGLSGTGTHTFCFVLIKRSARVAQPGDLSCPGGILHGILDPLLRPLISSGLLPVLRGRPRDLALEKDRDTFRVMTLFLMNAIREAWEEIGLNPFNIRFLGALPSYELISHRRIIFPLVAFLRREQQFHPNIEVERIVEIPLDTFLDEGNYGRFSTLTGAERNRRDDDVVDSPCLVYRDGDDREEILWGATYWVVMSFLEAVIGFTPPDPPPGKSVTKVLPPGYAHTRQEDR